MPKVSVITGFFDRFSFNQKIRTVQILNHIAIIVGVIYASWQWWVVGILAYAFLVTVVIDAGWHRLIAHRSFKTSKWIESALAIGGVGAAIGSTIGWAGLHRHHHIHSDTENDPHSPHFIGNWRSWFGIWKPVHISPKIVKDLISDPAHKFAHNHYFKILLGWAGVLFLINPWAMVFLFCLPASLVLHGTSLVSVPSHRWGYRRYDTKDHSYNNWLTSLLTFGEGWHNTHHYMPGSHRHGFLWWEFDPPAFVIEKFLMTKKTERVHAAAANAKISSSATVASSTTSSIVEKTLPPSTI